MALSGKELKTLKLDAEENLNNLHIVRSVYCPCAHLNLSSFLPPFLPPSLHFFPSPQVCGPRGPAFPAVSVALSPSRWTDLARRTYFQQFSHQASAADGGDSMYRIHFIVLQEKTVRDPSSPLLPPFLLNATSVRHQCEGEQVFAKTGFSLFLSPSPPTQKRKKKGWWLPVQSRKPEGIVAGRKGGENTTYYILN